MRKKAYHKNSKRPVSKTRKPKINRGIKLERFLLLDKIILFFYLAVGFVPHMNNFDVAITQWYYISILNMVVLGYLFVYKNCISINFHNKLSRAFFIGALLFLVFSCLSITKAISVSESLVFLCILINTLIAFFNLYIILKDKLKELFPFIAFILTVFLAFEALQVVHHFAIKNAGEPRSEELFVGLNPTYGNRNILAASLIVKTAFTFFIFYQVKNITKKIISLSIIYSSVFAILLVGARTAIYSLPIIFSILILGKLYLDFNKGVVPFLKRFMIPLFLVFGLAFFSALSVNKIHKGELNAFENLVFSKFKKDLYKEDNTIRSLASDSGRDKFWNAAIDGFKSSPIIGIGIGNWKVIDKKDLVYSRKGENHFYPRRAHNDFLQVLSEIGVFGFIVFIGLFIMVYYILILRILKKEEGEFRFIALICLAAFVAYSLDTLINFPSERTPIQILGFTLVAIVTSMSKKSNTPIDLPKYVKAFLVVVGVVVLYGNNLIYTSGKYQTIVRNNIRGKNILKEKYKVGYHQMNDLYPSFPKLNFMGQPIDYAKAVLAYSEGRYQEAMKHLDLAIKESPYTLEHYAFKSLIFRSNPVFKNQDSSIYYAKKVFDRRPGLINQYRILKQYYTAKKDTAALFDVISRHQNYLPKNENAWMDKINFYLKYKKDLSKVSELIDSAKLMVPEGKQTQQLRIINTKTGKEFVDNSDSLKIQRQALQKKLNIASKLFSQKKYKQAYVAFSEGLEMAPDNEEIRLSLALTDIKLKQYKLAIEKLNKVISSGNVTNGKPEYNRGLCYLKLGNKIQAGIDFRASYDKGFPMAKQLDKRILNY